MSQIGSLSIVVPAFNEEKRIGRCLASVRVAMHEVGLRDSSWELIVTDNACTDATAEIARRHGARVVREEVRQISRSRNAGASIARHEWLLFIDADSQLSSETLWQMLHAIAHEELVGGGALVALDGAPWIGRRLVDFWNTISRSFGWAAGSFIFCRSDAFRDVRGFSLELFAGEEVDLTQRLKAWGRPKGLRFRILTRTRHHSSGRKFQLYGKRDFAKLFFRGLRPGRLLRTRDQLDFFYDGRR
ncbi:MAG: glycosyltransferase [Planctomycetes bacterium]|nr:glycosyltransferase [Planctomycetota bacterium]